MHGWVHCCRCMFQFVPVCVLVRVHGCRLWSSAGELARCTRTCMHTRPLLVSDHPSGNSDLSLKSLFFICLSLARWLQVLIHQSNLSHRTPSHNEWMEPIQLPPPADTPNSALPAGETALKAGTVLLLHFICATCALWLDTCLLGGSNGFINVNRSLGRNTRCVVDSWLHHLDKLIVTQLYEAFGKELQYIWTKPRLLYLFIFIQSFPVVVRMWLCCEDT